EPTAEHVSSMCLASKWGAVAEAVDLAVEAKAVNRDVVLDAARRGLAAGAVERWRVDGAKAAYEAVVRVMSDAERWDVLKRMVSEPTYDIPSYRTGTLAESRDDICRFAATSDGVLPLRDGLRRLLDMHKVWISGSSRIRGIALEVTVPGDDSDVETWGQLFLRLLWKLLACDERSCVESAIRGVTRLLRCDPALDELASQLVRSSTLPVQRHFMNSAALLVGRDEYTGIPAWLIESLESPSLDLALAAWSALNGTRRSREKGGFAWRERSGVVPRIIPASAPLLDRPRSSVGLMDAVGRP